MTALCLLFSLFKLLQLSHSSCHLLIHYLHFLLDISVTSLLAFILISPLQDVAHCLQSGGTWIMESASQSTFLVSPVAILSDGGNAMATSIVCRNGQVGTDDGFPKNVLHSLGIPLIKLYPLDQRQSILCIREIGCLRSEAIQRHAGDASGPFFVQRVCHSRRSFVVIYDD